MKNFFLLVLVISTLNSFAQKVANPEVYAKTITAHDLKQRLAIVAGAEMEGRQTATAGQRRAAAYIVSQFKAMGLQPGNNGNYELFYNVYQDSLLDATLEVNGRNFQLDKDFNVSINNIAATMKFSEVVFVGANAVDSLKNANLAGRVVMIIGGAPQGFGRGAQGGIFGTLLSKGAAAIISVAGNYPRQMSSSRLGAQSTSGFRRNITPQQFTVSENVAKEILGNDYDNAKSNTSIIKIYPAAILLEVKKNNRRTPKQQCNWLAPRHRFERRILSDQCTLRSFGNA